MKSHGLLIQPRRSPARDALRMVLAFGVVLLGLPVPVPAAPVSPQAYGDYYFQNGSSVFHADYSSLVSNADAALDGSAEFSVTVSRAVFSDENLDAPSGFVLDPARPTEEIVSLDWTRNGDGPTNGTDPREITGWEEVVTWSVMGRDDVITTAYRVGLDYVSMTVPRSAVLDGPGSLPASSPVLIEANGIVAELDTAFLTELEATMRLSGESPAVVVPGSLAAIAESFQDLPGFINGVSGLVVAEEKARTEGPLALTLVAHDLSPDSCWGLCISCVGSLVGSVALYVALISACGAALVTGGVTAIGCIMAFLGLQASHLMVMGSCSRCAACLD